MFSYQFEAKIWIPIKPATIQEVQKTNFIAAQWNPGVILLKIYEISTHSVHTTFSTPFDSPSIHIVYWHVAWHRRNPAATVKFRIHTFHRYDSIHPVRNSIHEVYWFVFNNYSPKDWVIRQYSLSLRGIIVLV